MGGDRCAGHRAVDSAGADPAAAIGDRRSQLQSAELSLKAMTGDRGMAQLLSGTTRNYLPSNWTQVTAALAGGGTGGYGGLSANVRNAIAANAILSPQRLATLSSADQQQIQAARQWSAMQQALSQAALANASGRFDSLQGLIAAISNAADQKAVLGTCRRESAPNSACCRMSRPRSRCCTSRPRLRKHPFANRRGSARSTNRGDSKPVSSRCHSRRLLARGASWVSLQPFGAGSTARRRLTSATTPRVCRQPSSRPSSRWQPCM